MIFVKAKPHSSVRREGAEGTIKAEQEPLPLSGPPPPRSPPQPTRALRGPAVRAREQRKGRERRGIQLQTRPGRCSDASSAPWATAVA
uniref:Uncharacterized protein n=1 Tax=Rangifer tarandus platyrhynchus TaxID=3082113 RepID=A0ACB0FP47_RANTA|nr:unnamed protein product [Rangifer tarandus platyrhynchus]